ncbi:DUF1460 domain-containing protein [bacterium]|nr:DUF1460 domain-containing protein [bacterium]
MKYNKIPDKVANLWYNIKDKPLNSRLNAITKFFLGCPYILEPLGEGTDKPRANFEAFDCMTYVEQSLALAITPTPEELLQTLDRIRYKNSEINYYKRNHFVSIDWLPNNQWLLEEATTYLYPAAATLQRTISKKKFFEEKKTGAKVEDIEDVTVQVNYIPLDRMNCIEDIDISPLIILFVGNRENIIVAHMGFIIKEGNNILLRHASSDEKKVVERPLFEYLKEKKDVFTGVMLVKVRDDY